MERIACSSRVGIFTAVCIAVQCGVFCPALLADSAPSLESILSYRYVSELVASGNGDSFAWVENVRGVRNIWFARASDSVPHQLTRFVADDGQELTQLKFSSDGLHLIYVRGGDHDANWPATGNLAPDPGNDTVEPKVAIWLIATTGSAQGPVKIVEGDRPALSTKGQIAYVNDGQIWSVQLPKDSRNADKGKRLFFDRGKDDSPLWSPDGTRLAFVSRRDDHSFIGVYSSSGGPLVYLSPSTSKDEEPVWSPDGRSIAFVRQPSSGDGPENFLTLQPHPFALWTADAETGEGKQVWRSPDTLAGSLPDVGEDEPLFWMANNHLVFLAEIDDWPHLYEVDAKGGDARLRTPGNFMVEHVAMSADRQSIVFSANAGGTKDDEDRRHLFRLRMDSAPETLTRGSGIEWSPVALVGGEIAYVAADAQRTAAVAVLTPGGKSRVLSKETESDYPASHLVTPRLVSYQSPDGFTIQGQLFRDPGAASRQPGVIFVHGGPPRQMLLGWHYMDYYSNAYAVNQFLALHGFTVLSVNYRLGIGYGRAFQHPERAGPAGASEYQDVLAGARYLQKVDGVDPGKIGIWGGSYGGYLTGLALARNSDVFKAGVDFHGLSNWLLVLAKDGAIPAGWYEADADWKKAVATAFAASPDADIATWKSPVLLIQGDDDRNVPFDQTVELAHRLELQRTPFEELVIPNEIHGFLRWGNWLRADEATVRFLTKQLLAPLRQGSGSESENKFSLAIDDAAKPQGSRAINTGRH